MSDVEGLLLPADELPEWMRHGPQAPSTRDRYEALRAALNHCQTFLEAKVVSASPEHYSTFKTLSRDAVIECSPLWGAQLDNAHMAAKARHAARAAMAPATPREYQVARAAAPSDGFKVLPDGSWDYLEFFGRPRPESRRSTMPSAGRATDRAYVVQGPHEIAERMRNTEAAKEIIAREKAAADVTKPFDAGTIDEILARPTEPDQRVTGLIPWDASTLVVAQRKTGKTTLLGNLACSLITGAPFLGRFDVQPVTGRVAFLNFEVSARTAAQWFRDMGIPSDRFELVNLRGARNPLGHPGDRAALAARLRALDVETVITDPLANAFYGESQQSNDEIGSFLRDLDRFVREEVGARDNIIAAHAGWGEHVRGRGASAMEDWPDSIITLTKDNEHGDRFLRAFGRDIDVDEAVLSFDYESRRLTMGDGGSRRDVTDKRAVTQITPAVVDFVKANPGCSQNIVETDVEGNRQQIRKALESAAVQGLIERTKEAGRWVHNPPRPTSPSFAPGEVK